MIKTLLMSFFSGVFYRMGGSDKWDTKWRDLCIPLLFLLFVWQINLFTLLSAILLFVSLTTYWDKDANNNVTRLGWLLTGSAYGLSALPYSYSIQRIGSCFLRAIILAYFMAWWTEKMNRPVWKWSAAVVQEFGKGFAIVATLPLLYL